jgi:hypothetical protein
MGSRSQAQSQTVQRSTEGGGGRMKTHVIRGYKFSQKEIARHRCIDCGVNVIKIGDYCMLSSAIWRDRFGLGWSDNLCVGCIEQRLGRPLSLARGDFCGTACVKGFPPSEVLVKRLGLTRGRARTKRRRR